MAEQPVLIAVEQEIVVGDCQVEIQSLRWNTADYVRMRQDRCRFSLTLGVPRGQDRGHWRIEGSDRDVETGHCGAVEADRAVDVRLAPGRRRSVVCSIESAAFSRLTGTAAGWFEPEFLTRLDRDDTGPRRALRAMAEELSAPRFARDIAIEGQALILFSEVGRILQRGSQSERPGSLQHGKIARLQEMVQDGLADGISIAGLARELGMSRRHLGRSFKAATGLTLRDYIEDVRLTKVMSLLADTALPLKAIAPAVGLANANYLSSAFSRRMGISPGAYRRQLRAH